MAAYTTDRPALGQVAALGSFYNARDDTFIPYSLFKTPPPKEAVTVTENHSTTTRYTEADTYKDKFDLLSVKAELGASILAGLASVGGAGQYLAETRSLNLVVQASMHYSITTVDERLDLMTSGVADCLVSRTLDSDFATHVVIGITWGARCVVSARKQCVASADRSHMAGELQSHLGLLRLVGTNAEAGGELDKDVVDLSADQALEVTVHGDVLANDGLVPTDFASARAYIRNLPKYIECANDGKGKPISYALMPLPLLGMFKLLEIEADVAVRQLSVDCLEMFVKLLDDHRSACQRLSDYRSRLLSHSGTVRPNHLRDVEDALGNMRGWEATVKSEYATLLKEVRSGRADGQQLWGLLDRCRSGDLTSADVQDLMRYVDKMDFVDLVSREGAKYVGYGGPTLSTLLQENRDDDAYIMYFNDELRTGSNAWNGTAAVLLELLRDRSRSRLIVVVDTDALGLSLDRIYVSQLRNGSVIVTDVLEHRKVLATNCVMQFSEDAIDRTVKTKPLQRRAVKIHCPQAYCDRTLQPNWICSVCHTIVEYGYVDDLLYCDCGSCCFDHWEFKCNDPRHGTSWSKFDSAVFKAYLDALEPFEELNILILGETGVGKSTWINAFINYLTFDTLEEAMAAEELKWVIPCSFQTQLLEGGTFVQRTVKVGSDKNENDGSAGQSATQQTSVYAVDIGTVRVRLIDTPGIGDTRGPDQDNKNMADILRVLRSYNNLHGILILLKPNAPRLTVMFRFCIKQLLTHLHRNAADNIVFGFTNTRGSNYKPGDTFKPLENLLKEHTEVHMGLYKDNVYCFDSESFRHLAAQKQGIDMGFLEDNCRSWSYSVEQCKDLVKHFKEIKPHQVRSTINLNETRNMIIQLTEPMALLAQKMASSIAVNEEQIKELQKTKLSRAELEKRLFVQKESLASSEVDKPRTICTNAACVEFSSNFEGRDEITIIYKQICHELCYLSSVKPRTKGDPDLQRCTAMNGDGMCSKCGHRWWDHMHIYYEYQPMTYRHRDTAVDRDLTENASAIQLKEEAIRMKGIAIEEYRLEHEQVQKTAIQFGFFLKRHAIMPYSDATLEYIDMLIDQEKMKIQSGGKKSREALGALEKYRAEHIEQVAILKKAMERGDESEILDDGGIRQAIDSLFGLPHFGRDLRAILNTKERAAQATYRERSFNISAGSHWHRPTEPGRQDYAGRSRDRGRPGSPGGSWWWAASGPRQHRYVAGLHGSNGNAIPGAFPGAFPGPNGDGPVHVVGDYARTQPSYSTTAQPAPSKATATVLEMPRVPEETGTRAVPEGHSGRSPWYVRAMLGLSKSIRSR